MTHRSSFLGCQTSFLFSGLASGIRRPASDFSGRVSLLRQGYGGHVAGQAGIRRLSFPLRRFSDPDWRLASGVRRRLHGPSSAFSLVEVTLALMVMAIGILSIMSLFPAGLDQNARSIADTHAAFFAEEVFGGLHARAETNWFGLDKDLPIATTNWDESVNPLTTFITSTVATNKYCPKSKPDYEDHALRYRLVLTTNGLIKSATLFVWPGEFGSTNDPSIFYAEFFRWKPL